MSKIDELIEIYKSVYYIEDPAQIPLIMAVMLSHRTRTDPIWLMLVGSSSSGKSELINAIMGIPWVHQVSTLTENTLLSGMPARDGNETSLLRKIKSGVIAMKDFTSILSMNTDKQQAIMGQLREVYDGYMVKETGMGKKVDWKGKITFIGGVTEKIHAMEAKFASFGKRELYYSMPEQNRINTTLRSILNRDKIIAERSRIKEAFTAYIKEKEEEIKDWKSDLPQELLEEIIALADFSSLARSGIEKSWKNEISLVLSPDMPMRMANQLATLSSVLMFMYDGQFNEMSRSIISKLALDSIPKGRRITIKTLAQYFSADSAALATSMNYPTEQVNMWLHELNGLGLVTRDVVNLKNIWRINDRFKALVLKYENLKEKKDNLFDEDSVEISIDSKRDFDGF